MNLFPNVFTHNRSFLLNNKCSRTFLLLFFILILTTAKVFSQPYVDIMSFNYQNFSSQYTDSAQSKNKTGDYFVNLFIPKQYKNENVLLMGFNYEMLNSSIVSDSSYSSKLYYLTLPLGFRFTAKSKKWNIVVMSLQRLASDFKDVIDKRDYQYGGVFLHTIIKNEKLKFKYGLYYNREFFGDFFVPLVGVDWRINNRVNMYGVLPSFYRVEFNVIKNKLYAGLGVKFLNRSFRLSKWQGNDYVRYNERQLKIFADYFVYKNILLFAELGYSIGDNPLQYRYNTKDEQIFRNAVYTEVKSYPLINVGLAFRVRMDLEKKE